MSAFVTGVPARAQVAPWSGEASRMMRSEPVERSAVSDTYSQPLRWSDPGSEYAAMFARLMSKLFRFQVGWIGKLAGGEKVPPNTCSSADHVPAGSEAVRIAIQL